MHEHARLAGTFASRTARSVLILAACSLLPRLPQPNIARGAESPGERILRASGVRGGLVVHLGCSDGRLTAALHASDRYVVHGLDTDREHVREAREHIRSLGRYGPVSADTFDGRHLPYVANLVNLLVADELGDVPVAEIMRVLAPGGVALVGGQKMTKAVPPAIDEWTHWLHGADGNPVAGDQVVGPPRRAQWVSEPRWQRHHEASPSVSAVVSSGGRLFAIVNQAPAGIDGLPDRWALVARDAFNGKLLWTRPIAQWGSRFWSDHSYGHGRWNHPTNIARRLVAVGDRVYVTLGLNAPVAALDAATGQTVRTYAGTEFTDEILYGEGTLVLAANAAPLEPGRIRDQPAAKKSVLAVDAQTGKIRWRTDGLEGAVSKADALERITHLMMVLGGGAVYCIEENAVVALDLKTGERRWRFDRPPRPRTVTYGSYYITNLNSMVYHDGMLLFMEPDPTVQRMPYNAPTKCTLLGLDAGTGRVLWRRPCGFWGHYGQGDIFVIHGLVWVHEATGFSMVGLDPDSGDVQRSLPTREALDQGHHHRCYRNKATTRYVITGRRGAEFIDLATGENFRHHWVRGTCRYGVMPANGLLYAPPHPCVCYITAKLNGFWALAPAEGSAPHRPGAPDEAPWERGPAFAGADAPPSHSPRPSPTDWPTYRRDSIRSGHCPEPVPPDLTVAWQVELGGRLSAPGIAGGKVLAASVDEHTVYAIDERSGNVLWEFTAGGRVDTPPTIHQGLALFGSADGWLYCLRADDGQLAWRRRIAPEDRRMMSHDQLESPWPLSGSVLVQDGMAYVVAGRSSFLDGGMHVAAIDPGTGKLVQAVSIDSLDPATGDMVDAKMYYDMPPNALGALPDILVGGQEAFYLRHLRFDPKTLAWGSASRAPKTPPSDTGRPAGRKPAPDPTRRPRVQLPVVADHLISTAGLLDDSWFNQTYWTIDGAAHSKLLVFDDRAAYGVKPYRGSARHSRAIFRPGTGGYTLFAETRPDHARRWSVKVPVRIVAMVLAGQTLFVAGPPDMVDPEEPWAAIDGRRGAVLWAVSAKDGAKLAQHPLDAPPTYDGLAAANGRLYLATRTGRLVCLAGRQE